MSQPNRLPADAAHQFGGIAIDRSKPLAFKLNGRRIEGFAGDTVLSAALGAGIAAFGTFGDTTLGLGDRLAPLATHRGKDPLPIDRLQMAERHESSDVNERDALMAALRQVIEPLAELAVQRGLPYATVEELVRRAFVAAADAAHPDLLPHRKVSRIAITTGINRREVGRLLAVVRDARAAQRLPSRSVASEVFAHWVSDARYRDRHGEPRVLRRQGRSPSFESLARLVTRDVHPRSLLDELVRLKLAVLDRERDTVTLVRDGFVPSGDRVRMLQFLGANVGDHAAGAVANVLADGQRHFEQAVFADGLAPTSVREVWAEIGVLWKGLLAALVPLLEGKVERGADTESATQRLRVGLYTFDADMALSAPPTPTPTPRKPRKRR